ncbi:MAG: phosphomannomutase/phosphoglucomutase [Candidatus Magasanikbacteria bacterium]|nr:phosphomannomutase/phosphoglucomutase [Candidatus Magasanikbacteria bacterium]
MIIAPQIFKAYDIRGLAETELSPDLAYSLGRSFVVFLRAHNLLKPGQAVVVGRDMRLTSPSLQSALMKGVHDENVPVVDIGLASTPLFNFACANYPEHAGGVMVTASHNPAKYNGFKMTLGDGLPVGEAFGMAEIKDLVANSNYAYQDSVDTTFPKKDVLQDYIQKVFSVVPQQSIRPMKLVVDAGNGMAKVSFPEILKKLPVEVEYLYLEPDGSFPNHEANPLKVETLAALQKKVVETGADFGFALDGDADRVGLVDEKGKVVEASFVGALVGLEVLRRHVGARMLYDLRSSMIVPEVWQAAGASVEMCKVGHANIKKALKETNGAFASELSLHLYYHDTFDVESTDLSLLYVLQLLSRENKPLSEVVAPLKKYFHSGEINFEIEDKLAAVSRVEEKYKNEALETSHLDGLWMRFDWGWLSVRLSNTEPVVRLNLEARSAEVMQEKINQLSAVIKT